MHYLIRDCKSGPYMECEGSQSILYAWAKDAPAKFLPKGEEHNDIGNNKSLFLLSYKNNGVKVWKTRNVVNGLATATAVLSNLHIMSIIQ